MEDWGAVFTSAVLFILLSPGLLFQLPGRDRYVQFGNFQTSGAAILVHTVIFFVLVTILVIGLEVHTYFGSKNSSDICTNLNSIPMLSGSNFKKWKEFLSLYLGASDLDYALRHAPPPAIKDSSSIEEKRAHENWERSNRMCLMTIKCTIPESLRDTLAEEATDAKILIQEIEKRYHKEDRAETSTLINRLTNMKYKGKGNIREHIMEMSHIRSKLKALNLELPEQSIVYMALNSLPPQYNQFKVSYNCQKDPWSLNELISHCVQEEERLKAEQCESAHLTVASFGHAKDKGKRKGKQVAEGPPKKKQRKEVRCFFCKRTGHLKKDCAKRLEWFKKKGLPQPPQAE